MKFSSTLLPLLAVATAVRGDSLRNPVAAAEQGRELWGADSGHDDHHHTHTHVPSCVWSPRTDICPNDGKGPCDKDQWLCESEKCRGTWYSQGCDKKLSPQQPPDWSQGGWSQWSQPPQNGDWSHGGWSEPAQCLEPAATKRATRAECCPCCSMKTCDMIRFTFDPPSQLSYLEDFGESVDKLFKFAFGQSEQCISAFTSYGLESDLEESIRNGAGAAGVTAEGNGKSVLDLQVNSQLIGQVITEDGICSYDTEEGDVLERPLFGLDPACADAGDKTGGRCPRGDKSVTIVSDSYKDCCAKKLGLIA